MVIEAVYQGLLLGLALAVSAGPSFFAIIQTGSKRGFRPALSLAIGIFLSDLFCVVLAYLGLARLFDNPQYKIYVGIIGGTVLAMFGFFTILQSKSMKPAKELEIKAVKNQLFIVKGFLLNILNPIVLGLWMACVVSVTSNPKFGKIEVFFFFMTSLLTIFFLDVLKAYSANKITKALSEKILHWINIIAGTIMMIFGLLLIYKVFV
jgi:threonine/homoserine/homoserine lactone efflux protein